MSVTSGISDDFYVEGLPNVILHVTKWDDHRLTFELRAKKGSFHPLISFAIEGRGPIEDFEKLLREPIKSHDR